MKKLLIDNDKATIEITPRAIIDTPRIRYTDKTHRRHNTDRTYYRSRARGETIYYYLVESGKKLISRREKRDEMITALDSFYGIKKASHKMIHAMTPSLPIIPRFKVKFAHFG